MIVVDVGDVGDVVDVVDVVVVYVCKFLLHSYCVWYTKVVYVGARAHICMDVTYCACAACMLCEMYKVDVCACVTCCLHIHHMRTK